MFAKELQPSLDEVLAVPADLPVAVYRSVPADTETPISAYLKLRRGGTGFLLESAEQDGSLGRYSFLGVSPDAVLRADLEGGTLETEQGVSAYEGPPLEAVRRLVGPAPVHSRDDIPVLAGGAVGGFGYELARSLERLPAPDAGEPSLFPAALFARFPDVVVFDHRRQRLLVVSIIQPGRSRKEAYARAGARIERLLAALRRSPSAPVFEPAGTGAAADVAEMLERAETQPSDQAFLRSVEKARQLIHGGDAIQVVLSRRLQLDFSGDPFRVYRALRVLNPSPYMFFLEFPELALVGASPEMLIRVSGEAAQVCPIAGTRPRGVDAAQDVALEKELCADAKERAEHVMLVDLARNDLGRVCRPGSVHVQRFMQVDRYSHVMHLVSTVTGRLSPEVDALSALSAAFPAGTLTGAPKIRAMEIIHMEEPMRRGIYGGAMGYVAPGAGTLDTCIAIRTVLIRRGRAYVQAGAGIVADSEARKELAETNAKAAALLSALAMAGLGNGDGGSGTLRKPPRPAGHTESATGGEPAPAGKEEDS